MGHVSVAGCGSSGSFKAMQSEASVTATGRTSATRLERISAQAMIGWPTSGADAEGLERIAFAVPTVFAMAFGVRAIGALPFTQPATVGRTVLMDVVVVVAGLIFIVVVGSFGDRSGVASYAGIIMATFLVPGTAVASLLIEMVRRIRWLTIVAAVGSIATGVVALGIYARGFIE